jgi:hypothetical protein
MTIDVSRTAASGLAQAQAVYTEALVKEIKQAQKIQREAVQEIVRRWELFYEGVLEIQEAQHRTLLGRIENAETVCRAAGGRVGGEPPTLSDRQARDMELGRVWFDGAKLDRRWSRIVRNFK